MKALVISSSKNIFKVNLLEGGKAGEPLECRIKGKILKGVEGFYNPLAPGDIVEIDEEKGLVLELLERKNMFSRFNQKGQKPQLLASNVDLVLCVCSVDSPPFRPRFLDRALLQAEAMEIPSVIVCNKYDLCENMDIDIEERLSDFERLGYPVFRISVKNNIGLDSLKDFISGKFSLLMGQSGVGKSSLVNFLIPTLLLKTREVSDKFNRGRHTTTQPVLYEVPGIQCGTRIIDTPGIRRFVPYGIESEEIIYYMKEFAPLAGKCSFGLSCSHESERGCKIMEAVSAGVIHEDRYESFLRIREELSGKKEYPDND